MRHTAEQVIQKEVKETEWWTKPIWGAWTDKWQFKTTPYCTILWNWQLFHIIMAKLTYPVSLIILIENELIDDALKHLQCHEYFAFWCKSIPGGVQAHCRLELIGQTINLGVKEWSINWHSFLHMFQVAIQTSIRKEPMKDSTDFLWNETIYMYTTLMQTTY